MITHKDHTHPAAAKRELKKQFATFDAAKAECFLPKDKHRLLAVVEAGFGDFQAFNTKMRGVFQTRLVALSRRRSSASKKGASSVEAAPAAAIPEAVEMEAVV